MNHYPLSQNTEIAQLGKLIYQYRTETLANIDVRLLSRSSTANVIDQISNSLIRKNVTAA